MLQESGQQEPHEGTEQEQHGDAHPPADSQANNRQRPRGPVRASTTASVLGSMEGDPETSQKIDRVMDQLDEQGKDELRVLASRVATGAKRKGRIAQEDRYLEQNPWHDQGGEKTLFSLGEPLPHKEGNYSERNPWHGQEKEKPVFSLGEPLPRTVRKRNHPEAAAKQAEEDVEQGMRRRPTKEGKQDAATPETDRTEETLQNTRSHRGEQDQGTDSEYYSFPVVFRLFFPLRPRYFSCRDRKRNECLKTELVLETLPPPPPPQTNKKTD